MAVNLIKTGDDVNSNWDNIEAAFNNLCQGRLTLSSTEPVTTSDQADKGTLYFLPYSGNRVTLYDSTNSVWELFEIGSSEVSLSLSGLTSGTNYDIFIYDSSGTLTLESVAWTNDTIRATNLAKQDGVYIKSGDTTKRYLGTIRIGGTTGETHDTQTRRFVWNYYNRVNRHLLANQEDTDGWTYTTATWRVASGTGTVGDNQVELVIGVSEDPIFANVKGMASNTTNNVKVAVGVGLSDTTNVAQILGAMVGADFHSTITAYYRGFPGIGYY